MQLTFEAADFRYAIDVSDVVEVVPWVDVQPVAGTPDWLRGYFSYRGVVTPVIDACILASGIPCRRRWSSRLIIVRLIDGDIEQSFGLLAERVTEVRPTPPAVAAATVSHEQMTGWGRLLLDQRGVYQLIDVQRLLPPDRRGILQLAAERQS